MESTTMPDLGRPLTTTRRVPIPPDLGRPAEADDIELALEHVGVPFEDREPEGVQPAAISRAWGWSITTDSEAEWALRKLASAEREIAADVEQANEWKAQIDSWLEQATARPKATAEFFRGKLTRYALDEREANDRATVQLPSGKVGTRRAKAKVVIADERELLGWVGQHPDADEMGPRKLLISEVRKRVELLAEPARIDLAMACGCVVADIVLGDEDTPPAIGEADECDDHGEQAVVGITVLESRLRAVSRDREGEPIDVPGADIYPEAYDVTVSVKK